MDLNELPYLKKSLPSLFRSAKQCCWLIQIRFSQQFSKNANGFFRKKYSVVIGNTSTNCKKKRKNSIVLLTQLEREYNCWCCLCDFSRWYHTNDAHTKHEQWNWTFSATAATAAAAVGTDWTLVHCDSSILAHMCVWTTLHANTLSFIFLRTWNVKPRNDREKEEEEKVV